MEEKIRNISKEIEGMKYYEWCKIRNAIEKSFSSAQAKVEVTSADEIENAIKLELL